MQEVSENGGQRVIKELQVRTEEIKVPITIPDRGYDIMIGQTDNGIVAFFDSPNQITDVYQLKFN